MNLELLLLYSVVCCSLVGFVEAGNLRQLEKRVGIMETKFGFQSYEISVQKQDMVDLKDRVTSLENETVLSSNIPSALGLKTGAEEDTNTIVDLEMRLNKVIDTLAQVVNAFQAEKEVRQKLESYLAVMEESHRLQMSKLEHRVDECITNTIETRKLHELEKQRVDALEAQLLWSKDEVTNLNNKLKKLENDNQVVKSTVDSAVQNLRSDLSKTKSQINTEISSFDQESKQRYQQLLGQLTTSRIFFSAQRSGNINDLKAWKTLVFNAVKTNEGNAYSSSTGIFTAPVNGFYVFYVHILGSDRSLEMCLRKNSNCVAYLYIHGPSHGGDSNMVIIDATEGDEFYVIKYGPWGKSPFYIHHTWTTFSGFFLHTN